MRYKPIDIFENAMQRVDAVVLLYEVLHNKRKRGARTDWLERLNSSKCGNLLPREDRFDNYIDGTKCRILFKEGCRIGPEQMSATAMEHVLRGAFVAAVLALDRYFHDRIVADSLNLIRGQKGGNKLNELGIPLIECWRAIERIRSKERHKKDQLKNVNATKVQQSTATKQERTARAGDVIKEAIQNTLHRRFVFQGPNDIDTAFNMLGIDEPWNEVARKMHSTVHDVREQLRKIVNRRNQIAHESDIELKIRLVDIEPRAISPRRVQQDIEWIRRFIGAVDAAI